MNEEARRQRTHHIDDFVEKQIPEEFMKQMRNFQRVVQIQFEDTMREVFKSSIEEC